MSLYSPALKVTESMLTQIAYGLEVPEDIAARYGIDIPEYLALEKEPWFRESITRKRAELMQRGDDLLQTKFRMMADDAASAVFVEVQRATDPEFKLKAFQTFAKLGGLEPRPSAVQGPTGPMFSISINVPVVNQVSGQHQNIKDAKFKVVQDIPTVEIKTLGESFPEEPPRSEGFRMPDFDMSPLVVEPV